MEATFSDALKGRRTYYAIGRQPVTSDSRIEQVVGEAVNHTPSSFNSQSSRVVILLGEQHERLWDIARAELKKIVPPESFPATEEKINGAFRSGYGSILFYEDMEVVAGLQRKFPAYSDNFPVWSQQSSGMLQLAVWTSLELDGWGASLQHYNPIIDDAVREAWDIPQGWKLIAQMPFGTPLAEPGPKEFEPLEKRIRLYR